MSPCNGEGSGEGGRVLKRAGAPPWRLPLLPWLPTTCPREPAAAQQPPSLAALHHQCIQSPCTTYTACTPFSSRFRPWEMQPGQYVAEEGPGGRLAFPPPPPEATETMDLPLRCVLRSGVLHCVPPLPASACMVVCC